jgi:hypothetical protein
MMHVGMDIDDKAQLFNEIYQVLQPGALFGVYYVMRYKDAELKDLVPWATDNGTSKLATPEQYKQALSYDGFEVSKENNRRDFALDFFKQLRAITEANGGPPPLGLHTSMDAGKNCRQNKKHD